ncbi:DUF2157 domain-containing protein [Stutzerimonas kirkiae]|uniref:DUF2157 domain-containing protein n=1 Tax=Stutzerimonas kirkiae TaxID=2211392 RepID=UPI0010385476|nr:DUF2157 domain-containing protein [Stutzerimonas kirkiae]TBV06961.1 DUF2157 domain-containing protein [Stutzerimonas kirkiae]
MSLGIDAKDLRQAVQAGILQPGQDQALLEFLSGRPQRRGSFQLAHVAYYLGALLIMGALGWLLNEAWTSLGDSALLALGGSYLLLTAAAGIALWRRQRFIPGGLLASVAVSLVPLVSFAALRLLDLWPQGQHDFDDYYRYIDSQWLILEVATILAGLLMLRLVPFPFIVMPIALALWFMSMDLGRLLFPDSFGWNDRCLVSLLFGLAVLLPSLWLDGRRQGDFAFWGYLAGLLAFWGGLTMMESNSEIGKLFYCLVNLLLLVFAVLLRRPLFMVFGGLGLAGYLSYLAREVFADSLLFPLFVSLIGIVLIALGMLYQKHRERLTASLRRRLPQRWLELLPALRR